MTPPLSVLEKRVGEAGRLKRVWTLASGAFLIGSAVLAFYFVYSFFDVLLKFSRVTRSLAFAGLLSCVYLVWRRVVHVPLRALRRTRDEAREFERTFPEVEQAVSTSVEYGTDAEKTERFSSHEIVGELVRSTESRTRQVDVARSVEVTPLLKAAGGLAGALVVAFVYWLCLPHMFASTMGRLFAPILDLAPPSFTVIEQVEPGDCEIPIGKSLAIEVETSGRPASKARAFFAFGAEEDSVEMNRTSDRRFRYVFQRVLEDGRYRVEAGDAVSRSHSIAVYEEPRVSSLRLKLTSPSYSGLGEKTLPEGTGDVRALKGTKVDVSLQTNKPVEKAELVFRSGRKVPVARTGLSGGAEFSVESDDEYRVLLVDDRGRTNSSAITYRVTVVPDRPPRVWIRKPAREIMTFKDSPVELELAARDDYGVSEVGIYHSLGLEERKMPILRPGEKSVDAKHTLHLAFKGYKGGELIAYYAYAIDNDDVGGPKEATGELHFIQTYDEEEYASNQPRMPTPEAVKRIDKLIEKQMGVMRKTFSASRGRGEWAQRRTRQAEREQGALKKELDSLTNDVERALQQSPAEDVGARPQELEHLRSAGDRMSEAVKELSAAQPRGAVRPQAEALRHLSETRRLLISKRGSDSFRRAMEMARRNEDRRRVEDLDELEKEMRELPKLGEEERRLASEMKKAEEEEKRRLREKQERMAADLAERARRLAELRREKRGMSEDAPRELSRAAQAARQSARALEESRERAAQLASRSGERITEAERALRRSFEERVRDAVLRAANRAKELARKQRQLRNSSLAERDPARAGSRQEELARNTKELDDQVGRLASAASRRASPEAGELARAAEDFRNAGAPGEMKEAARLLREGEENEAFGRQLSAESALDVLADDLRSAAQNAKERRREAAAQAAQRARELEREERALALAPALASSGGDPGAKADEQKAIAERTGALGRDLDGLDARPAERALERAGEDMRQAEADFRANDSRAKASAESAARSLGEAARMLESMGERELGRLVRSALKAAKESARAHEDAASRRSSGRAASSQAAAERELEAASEAKKMEKDLASATRQARRTSHERAGDVSQVNNAVRRQFLPERLEDLARRTRAAENVREESRAVSKAIGSGSRMLHVLVSELQGAEAERLRALAEAARKAADGVEELGKRLEEAESPRPSLREEAQALERDVSFLAERVERMGMQEEAEKATEADSYLKELTRSLGRKQLPRPTNALTRSVEGLQFVGDQLIRRFERVVREGHRAPPSDETEPERYRKLIEEYFRSLSED